MELSDFDTQLKRHLSNPNSLPFVCEGSPLKCRLFVVGTIGARRVEKPFIRFWDPSYGFRKERFLREIDQLYGGMTRTRKRIEAIANSVGQQVTLDTNIYLNPAPGTKILTAADKKTDTFEWLLQTIKPQVVLAYGKTAKSFFQDRGTIFTENSLIPKAVKFNGLRFKLLTWTHLTYQTSNAKIEEIACALAEALRPSKKERWLGTGNIDVG